MTTVGSVQVDILLAIDELRSQMATVNQELGKIQSVRVDVQTTDAMKALGEVGGYAERVFGAASNFIQGSVMNFVGFSQQMTALGALSGASAEQLKGLNDEAIRLGIATSKSPQQVAQAATELVKLGFSADKTTKELGGLVALSEATGGAMDIAGQVVGATTSIFDASATRIADIVAATANATAADMNDFLQVISKAGGVAKANGQSLEVLATAFGLIRNTGFTAETASTALKNSIIRLAAPTGKAKDGIDQLGIQLRDSSGNMRSLLDLIPEFRTALDNVSPEEKAQLVKAIFGDEAGPAFLGLLSTSQEKIQQTFDTITNSTGAAGDTSAQLLTGISGALEMFGGSVETVSLQVGATFAPALELAANVGISVLGVFSSLPAPIQSAVIVMGTAGVAVAGLVVAISTLEAINIKAKLATLGLGTAQLQQTAITYAQNIATVANTVATGVNNTVALMSVNITKQQALASLLQAKNLAISTIGLTINTATAVLATGATLAYNVVLGVMDVLLPSVAKKMLGVKAATNAAAVNFGAAIAVIGLAVGAFLSLKMAFDSINAGNAEAGAIKKANEELKKLAGITKETGKTTNQFFANWKENLNLAFEGYGIVDGIFNVFGMLGDQIKGTNDALSEYGGNWGRVNKKQLENQRVTLATEGVVNTVGQVLDKGQDLMNKYGVAMLDAGDKARLGEEGIAKFTEEAKKQIEVNQKQIDVLKAMKPVNETQATMINAQVSLLEGQNKVLNQRVQALNTDTTATEENADAQSKLVKSYDSVKAAMEQSVSDIELTSEQARTAIAESLAGGEITEDEAGKQTLALETQTLEDRLKAKENYLNELRLLEKTSAEPEEVAKVQKDIASVESESQKLRTEIANKGYEERKNSIDEALKDEEYLVKKTGNQIEATERKKVMSVKQAQLAGLISAQEAQKKIKEISLSTTDAEIKSQQANLQRKRDLLKQGIISEEEYEQAEGEILTKIGQLRTQKLDEQLSLLEQKKQDELNIYAKTNESAQRAIAVSENNKIMSVKQAQLAGVISVEEAQKRIKDISLNTIDAQIKGQQSKLTRLKSLFSKGVITAEEYAQGESEILDKIAQLRGSKLDAQIAIVEDRKKKELEAITKANAQAERAIAVSVDTQIATLKNKLVQGVITEEEYQRQVAQIQATATNQEVQLAQGQLQQLEDLKARRLITEEEYYQQKISLEDKLASLNQTRLDQQLEAQKKARDEAVRLIQERTDFEKGKLEEIIFAEEQRINALKAQSELLNAQLGLQQAQATLEEQRLQFAVENAKTEGEKFAKEQQLQDLKEKNLLKTQEVELKVLEIKQEQAMIEARRQKTLADIAVLEAQAALASAQARGASQAELSALERVLGMKQEIAKSSDAAIAQQAQLNEFEKATVLTKQQAEREALIQQGKKLDNEQIKVRESAQQKVSELDKQLSEAKGKLEEAQASEDGDKIKSAQDELAKIQTELDKAKTELQNAPTAPREDTSYIPNGYNPNLAKHNSDLANHNPDLAKRNSLNQNNFVTQPPTVSQQLQQQGLSSDNIFQPNLGKIPELSQPFEVTPQTNNVNNQNIEGLLTQIIAKIDGVSNNLTRPNIQVSTATPLEDTLRIMGKRKD